MPTYGKLDPKTEAGKMLLHDFLNYKTSGWSPFDKPIGGAAHWRSRKIYMAVSQSAFRSQALKTAKIAIKALEAQKDEEEDEEEDDAEDSEAGDEEDDSPNEYALDEAEDDDEVVDIANELYLFSKLTLENYKQTTARSPLNITYPGKDRIFVLFELDGDILDKASNEFELVGNNNKIIKIRRWSRVPSERLTAVSLISSSGIATSDSSYSFMDSDVCLIDAEIQRRMKGMKCENGVYWEQREEVSLEFPCQPYIFNKVGQKIPMYIHQNNEATGHAWGYFWLVGVHLCEDEEKKPKRIGGMMSTPLFSHGPIHNTGVPQQQGDSKKHEQQRTKRTRMST
jgi:hypothetical protein